VIITQHFEKFKLLLDRHRRCKKGWQHQQFQGLIW
jgi:hypothetical protein